jgi:peptidylamidoglycolate lyase
MDSTVKGSTIFEFDSSQRAKNHFGATGYADRTSCWFHDLAIDSKGYIYVGDIIGIKVLKFKLKK